MTFEEWFADAMWGNEDFKESLRRAWEAGQLEAAEHILELWNEPWPIRQKSFITMLREYVESLK
jgi:hypothetical protein